MDSTTAPALARLVRHAPAGDVSPPLDLYAAAIGEDGSLRIAALPESNEPPRRSACVLLTPLGLIDLFRTPLRELAGRRLPLPERCVSPHGLAQWIEARLAERTPLSGAAARVARAAMAIHGSRDGVIDVCRLARDEGITRRQLERGFRCWLGVSPMAYARRVRFERAAAALAAGGSILDAAIDHGYADQSHMTRAFGALARATPRQFARHAALQAMQRAVPGALSQHRSR